MTAATLTLSDFLLARIADDEEWARLFGCADEHVNTEPHPGCRERTVADCEAKRRIVDAHVRILTSPLDGPTHAPNGYCADDLCDWPCRTLRLLALPYADHPDYRDEWRP